MASFWLNEPGHHNTEKNHATKLAILSGKAVLSEMGIWFIIKNKTKSGLGTHFGWNINQYRRFYSYHGWRKPIRCLPLCM